ncbi:MAG: L-lactate dehydrogenase [Micropruina sp.]|nr:L-lactate dehydrogenase [Micropruina sp.]
MATTTTPTKLSVIGAGAVGSSLAYAALIRGSAQRIAIYDINEKKADAEARDLNHGTQFTPSSGVEGGGNIEVVRDSDVVIITAGAAQKPGQTRLELAEVNTNILKSLMPNLLEQAPNALYVLVTNPCDVLTVVAQKVSGLPTSRVFSTGTMLDTSRLRFAIAEMARVSTAHVHANILGEHGDTEFPVWSSAKITSIPIREWVDSTGHRMFDQTLLEQLGDEAMHAAYKVIAGKGATNYAIGLTGARLTEALVSPTRTVFPLSSVLDGWHDIHDVALSVPTMVSSKGIERVLDVPLDDSEIEKLKSSAATLRNTLKSLGF